MSFQNFQKTLKISDVNEADAGDYRCTATNNLGTAHHVIKVIVKGVQTFSCFSVEQLSLIATSVVGFNVSSGVLFFI